jgi:hypothetical protein
MSGALGSPIARKLAWRGGGAPPHNASSTARVFAPEMRITAMAARLMPLAGATMVSAALMTGLFIA